MSDGVDFKIDTSGLENALVRYMEYSKRTIPEVVNKWAIDVILKAAEYTPKAKQQDIQKALYNMEMIEVSPKSGKAYKNPRRQIVPSRLVYRIINARLRKKGKKELTGDEMARAAQNLIRARRKSVGYIAYGGWNKALEDLRGHGFGSGKVGKPNPRSYAAKGFGRKSKWGVPAIIMNNAKGARQVAGPALQRAIDERTKDSMAEVARRMKAAAR